MAKQTNGSTSNQINMIGEGAEFEGTFSAESDVRISGRLIGKLFVKGKAIIAQEGSVEGEIRASHLDVAGRVLGDIEVTERVVLKSSGNVEGNIKTARLVVEEGAGFNGKCLMGNRTVEPETIRRRERELTETPEEAAADLSNHSTSVAG